MTSTTEIRIAKTTLLDAGFNDEPGVTDSAAYMVDAIQSDLLDQDIMATVTMNSVEMQITVGNAQLVEAADRLGEQGYLA